ncbi:MAG: beta-galactosidase, partial [Phycisphaerae bacterium]|nr:beta-galactosidase [Phycisphaerae bacterium]
PLRMRVVVESDGPGHELVAELASHFQHFDRTLGTLSAPGTQTFEVELGDMEPWRHFGGEDDGMVRLPLRFQSLSLVRRGDKAEGAIRLRSIDVETEYTREQSVAIIPDAHLSGDDATFTVMLRNLSPEPVAGMLFQEIRDTVGSRQTQQQPLTLPGGAKPVVREMTCPMGERVFAEAAFRFVAEAFRTPEASITAVRAPAAPAEPGPTNPIGVGMYLYRYQGARDAPEKMQALADMARRAGVKWTREEFQWHTTEPERGRYHWDFYDELVRTAEKNDIRVYGLLAYWSGYAYHEKIAYTEQGVDEYARWAGQVVRRYKDRIKHWEVWNEPNIFFWSGPKPLYGSMLKKAYAAIKAADPEAQVLGCSTAGIDTAFIKKVLEWQAPFDVLTVHPYRGQLNETAFIDELKRTSELVDGRSVWITEMGWSSEIGATSERDQAGLVARTYLSALASGVVGSISWYDFRDDGTDPFYNEHNFGLLRHDLRPKAGYRALATVGSLLARHEAVGVVELGEGLLAFRFSAPGEDVVALWSTNGGQLVDLNVSPKATQAVDAMGQAVPIDDDGRLLTTLPSGWPLYLAGKNGLTVIRRPAPVRWIADPAIARPGDAVRLQIDAPPDWLLRVWHPPAGWRPIESARGGGAELRVPEDQPQGRVEFQAEFRAGGQIVYVPFGVYVQPALLRS